MGPTYLHSLGWCRSTGPRHLAQTGSGWPWNLVAGNPGYTQIERWNLQRTRNQSSSHIWALGQSCTVCHWCVEQLGKKQRKSHCVRVECTQSVCRVDTSVYTPLCKEWPQRHICVYISSHDVPGDHQGALIQMGRWDRRRISAWDGSLAFKRFKLIKTQTIVLAIRRQWLPLLLFLSNVRVWWDKCSINDMFRCGPCDKSCS